MRLLPFSWQIVVQLVSWAILPILPLTLTMIPLKQMMHGLIKVFL